MSTVIEKVAQMMTKVTVVPSFEAFQASKEPFSVYQGRLEQHFALCGVTDSCEKKAKLLSLMGNIEKMVCSCVAGTKNSVSPSKEFTTWLEATGPFERVDVDFLGPFKGLEFEDFCTSKSIKIYFPLHITHNRMGWQKCLSKPLKLRFLNPLMKVPIWKIQRTTLNCGKSPFDMVHGRQLINQLQASISDAKYFESSKSKFTKDELVWVERTNNTQAGQKGNQQGAHDFRIEFRYHKTTESDHSPQRIIKELFRRSARVDEKSAYIQEARETDMLLQWISEGSLERFPIHGLEQGRGCDTTIINVTANRDFVDR
ncbi:hypothetical protein RF11_14563 [Thelohanellus kitauei]|uniref:Uncharacterized protein n=1 Tax=Thelohanellus kitauei TaxID=669202 RepID=A0A0C2J7S9_THEKT|nr:hypothetical protein RF11_14563 [Thelohanellus kitauei]